MANRSNAGYGRRRNNGDRYSIEQYLSEVHYLRPEAQPEAEYEQTILAAQGGDLTARDFVIHYNLPMVVFMARDYVKRGVDFQDLIQEGNIGLMDAIPMWRIDGGGRFSTYAAYHIRKAFTYVLRNANPRHRIRVPIWVHSAIAKWAKVETRLATQLGREPSPSEVVDELGFRPKKLKCIALGRAAIEGVYSDVSQGGDEDDPGVEVPDGRPLPEHDILHREEIRQLYGALADVRHSEDPRRFDALIARFGLDGGGGLTLKALGARLGGDGKPLTRERARQIQESGLREVRAIMSA